MREKKRVGSTNLTVRSSLTDPDQRKGFKHLNRKSKRKQKLIQMNPGFEFYFDERGVCCYRKRPS